MPQLPSGRRIGLAADSVFALAQGGDFKAVQQLRQSLREPDDLLPWLDLVEYHPSPGIAEPGLAQASGVKLADLGCAHCAWPESDQQALLDWLHSEAAAAWLEERFDELEAWFEESGEDFC